MTVTRQLRFILPLLFVLGLLGAGIGLQPAEAVDIDGAREDLEQLKRSTKPKKTNEDLLQYLDAVFNNYKGLEDAGPPKPADDAPDEEKKAWAGAQVKFEKEVAKYRGDAEKLVLKILTLVKVKNNTNIRDDVNIRAASILGNTAPFLDEKGRKVLSKKIMTAIEKRLTKVKTHDINTEHLEACFAALGKLNATSSLQWMVKNYAHANEVQKIHLVAAHKALVLYKDVPGKLRHEVCDAFVKVYSSVESQAEQSSTDTKVLAKKRFWDDIKTHAIPVVQHYAGKPTDAEGSALATMADFQAFMRQHKNIRKEPWADAKIRK